MFGAVAMGRLYSRPAQSGVDGNNVDSNILVFVSIKRKGYLVFVAVRNPAIDPYLYWDALLLRWSREAKMASIGFNSLPLSHHARTSAALDTTPPASLPLRIKIKPLKPILVSGDPPTFVSAPGRRIVAVGDIHGDLNQARSALEIAGVLSSDGRDLWTGGETVLIQLGDILDRGEDELAILSLLHSLELQAKASGGAVFQVNGNHETMNVEGDFRYVDSGAFDECVAFLEHLVDCKNNWDEAFLSWHSVRDTYREEKNISQINWGSWNLLKRQKGAIARSILLRPGGPLACELAQNPVVLKVNDWIFCHGGLLPHHVAYGIERMNNEVSQWMRGITESESSPSFPFIATRGYDSVVWSRLYSRDTSELEDHQIQQIHSILEQTLQGVGAKGMVVGHTPQMSGVNCKYNCSIWRIDVGMSSGVLNSRPEVLEIQDDKARILRSEQPKVHAELQAVEYI